MSSDTNRKLAAGIIFYNDKKGLSRLLESIHREVDLMICIDGKFPAYPVGPELSDDGSREVASSYDNALLIDLPAPEYQKRSKYLEVCEQHGVDYLLILDTDEYAEPGGDWNEFRKNMVEMAEVKHQKRYNVFAVLMEVNSQEYEKTLVDKPSNVIWHKDTETKIEYTYLPRLWYRPEQMMYAKGTHYLFKNKIPGNHLNNQESNAAMEIISGVRFLHRNTHRSRDALQARKQYQLGFLVPYEQQLTSTYYQYYSWPGINSQVPEVPLK